MLELLTTLILIAVGVCLLRYSAARLLDSHKRGERLGVGYFVMLAFSLTLLFFAALGLFAANLKTEIIIIVMATGTGLGLLAWSIRSFAVRIRNKQLPGLGQCLLLFVALAFVGLFVCFWIVLTAGLGHSAAANARVPLVQDPTSLLSAQRAKNVILFIGDAGGIPTLNAASIYGYDQPQKLFVQRMPHIALSDTSSASSWVTDSAAGMTAIVTGRKTANGVISTSAAAAPGGDQGEPLKTILEYAEERGLSTGVVSNSAAADATPAACYAHASSRRNIGEIFAQVWKPQFGDGVDVVIGQGCKQITAAVAELGFDVERELRASGRPLYASIAGIPKDARRAVVLLDDDNFEVGEAAQKAIEILSRNPKGYFLMVECDLHTENAKRGLDRTLAFDRFIEKTARRMSADKTLILFTADHSFDLRLRSGKKGERLTLPVRGQRAGDAGKAPVTPDVRVDGGHTGEEVLVAAQGPGAKRVHGFLANTDLFHVMLGAYGWNEGGARQSVRPTH